MITAPRLIPRREVLAFITLTATEEHAPNRVSIREYVHEGKEWHCIDLDVDTLAAVKFWVQAFDHPPRQYREQLLRDGDALYCASHGTWRGWRTQVECTVESATTPDVPLDDATRGQLAALAEPAAPGE